MCTVVWEVYAWGFVDYGGYWGEYGDIEEVFVEYKY